VVTRADADPEALRGFVDALEARGLLAGKGGGVDDDDAVAPPDEVAGAEVPDDPLVVAMPLVLKATREGFVSIDHYRRTRAVLTPAELDALGWFHTPTRWDDALRQHRRSTGRFALREAPFRALCARLVAAGMLLAYDAGDSSFHTPNERARELADARMRTMLRMKAYSQQGVDAFDAAEATRTAETGVARTRIYPIQHNGTFAPLALGMVMAYAQGYDGGRLEEHYAFRPDWYAGERDTEELTAEPSVFLFSNYVWSHAPNLEVSQRVKAAEPRSLMVHGGPDSPRLAHDVDRYLATNPHIDVIVHGEGEHTLAEVLDAMAGRVGQGELDLSPLHDVPGISFRHRGEVVRTPDRDRIVDMDTIPSPFLTGLFDAFGAGQVSVVSLETNRGCPYGCTFCDWGSSTLSRIRKFDMERVFAEIEWCGQHQIPNLWFADANFGIFERDVEIAEKVAEVKERYGYPQTCQTNYAKNTAKHLRKIVQLWVDAGMIGNGVLSLQSTNDEVLAAVRRKNIKVEKYDELAVEFREAELALFVDLMLGLPGSTTQSFHDDLQDCIDREVVAKIFPTTLLPNSPMNDPEYKAEHRIEVAEPREMGKGNSLTQLIVSTSSFTRADMDEWLQFRRVYMLLENFGVLRQVARYVRHETGQREIDFYVGLARTVEADPERWPGLSFLVRGATGLLAPPASWGVLIDETRRYVVEVCGVADDPALDSVLAVQHALLPARERRFPESVPLAHDYAAWHADAMTAKRATRDWPAEVRPLRDYGPATFTVDDPADVCSHGQGYDVDEGLLDSWEMASPVSRPIPVRPAIV
jgi:radical SAM superfamily enzyme YgiQ (UPF0313 family)